MSSHDYTSIEDLLLATPDAVSRFRVGQREAAGAALDAGTLLTAAKGRYGVTGLEGLAWHRARRQRG